MRRFASFAALLALATCARADDWPQWLGLKRDGASAEVVKPWKAPLKVAWKQTVGVPTKQTHGYASPVIAQGKVYVFFRTPGKNEETLSAFDAVTGKPVWNTPYARPKADFPFGNDPRSSPAVVDGKVYTYGITGMLTRFDAESGKIDWQVDAGKVYQAPSLTFGCSCSPIVVGDHVLINVGAKGASIVAFDKTTGKEVWKKLDDGATYSSPIIVGAGDKAQVIFLTAKGLVGLSPKDGTVYWQHPLVDLILESSTTPVVANDILFGSSITFGGLGLRLESDAGKPAVKKLWTNGTLNCYFATPVAVGKDSLYMVTGSLLSKKATLRCVDPSTGKERWSRPNVGKFHASLLRTGDDKILLVEEAGNLVLLDPNPKEYRELARTKICGETWVHPALANGRLYIRDATDLICVEMPK